MIFRRRALLWPMARPPIAPDLWVPAELRKPLDQSFSKRRQKPLFDLDLSIHENGLLLDRGALILILLQL
jgi:hypothetical protein